MRRQIWRREEIAGFVADKLREYGYLSPADLPVDPFKIAALEGLHVDFRPLNGTRGWLVKGPLIATAMLDESQPFHHTFTLAHELIHYWIHPPGVYQDADGKGLFERQASRAAAELLMPAAWVKNLTIQIGADAGPLAQVFGVSRQAMEIRLEELGIITGTLQRQEAADRQRHPSGGSLDGFRRRAASIRPKNRDAVAPHQDRGGRQNLSDPAIHPGLGVRCI